MKSRSSLRQALGLALAFAFFAASVWHVFSAARPRAEQGGAVTLRIGHWLMHAGMREAFDEAAREYERLHPDVKVEQIAVPLYGHDAAYFDAKIRSITRTGSSLGMVQFCTWPGTTG